MNPIAQHDAVAVETGMGARRVVVVSDLHLGGSPAMMSRPDWLEAFIDRLPAQSSPCESLELVIAGDVIDFLAIPPYADFTPDPIAAVQKLDTVIHPGSEFAGIFDALGRHLSAGRRLTILVGNHDIELALPSVQDALLRRLGASSHDVKFIDDGRAYRIGGALIEHGNAYDGANANDWTGLRHLASAQSRARTPEIDVVPSPGSQIVTRIVNDFKARYPFVSLLQPEGELLVMLLLAFEPSLRTDLSSIIRLLRGKQLASASPKPGARPISAISPEERELDTELQAIFGADYDALRRRSAENVSATSAWLRAWVTPNSESLSEILRHGRSIPAKRLDQLRLGLAKLLSDDESDNEDGPAEQYGREAERMLSTIPGLDAVVMGHTHLPRRKRYGHGTYINSGTWIDRFRVPVSVLQDDSGKELDEFLRLLSTPGGVTVLPPTYADLRISSAGRVTRAELGTYSHAAK